MTPVARIVAGPWVSAGLELFGALEAVLAPPRSPAPALLAAVASTLVAWWVYVPIHELLHAAACLAFGGEVRELEIGARYGGALLERVIPFVKARGDYAGRLTGFDTHGSDLAYLATVAAPYLPTVAAAFPMLRRARRDRSPLAFGAGAVLTAAPAMGLIGDFYEMGSILVSDALGVVLGSTHAGELAALRHDDLLAFLPAFAATFPRDRWVWGCAVAAGALAGCALAGCVLEGSRRLADRRGA